MFPASSKGGGQSLGFPDVCKTPVLGVPVPVPFPNIAVKAAVKKSQQKKTTEQKKVGQVHKELSSKLSKATASFERIEARHANTMGYDEQALKQYALAMQAAIEAAQKLQQALFQAASATVAHCETKRVLQPSQTTIRVKS
jgi:hypothetical protein